MKTKRPIITSYQQAEKYLIDMLAYLKANQRSFSVVQATKKLRRVSPALISLIKNGSRRITLDRVDELAKLMRLTSGEKRIFKQLVSGEEDITEVVVPSKGRSEKVSTNILRDWINIYVKDCFHIESVQRDPSLVFKLLSHISSHKRIEKSLQFLLREGYLRTTQNGSVVVNTQLSIANEGVTDEKIQNFHRGALSIAKEGIKNFTPDERHANALTIALDEKGYEELLEIVQRFSDDLMEFAKVNRKADRLYQFILNVTPTGGSS